MFKPKFIGNAIIERPLEVCVDGMTMKVVPGEYPAFRMPGYAGVYIQFSGHATSADYEGRTVLNYFVQDGEAAPDFPRIKLAA